MVWLDYRIFFLHLLKIAEADVMIWCALKIIGENGAECIYGPDCFSFFHQAFIKKKSSIIFST